ncbi:dynein regulatory complex protein 12 [Genypterus blacodes]|uniref:dynein regulatory complex protein 12 n=1 Tax=Genypterus blacodes TaxID=154954 RepID=UPI003F75A1CC
MPPKKKTKNTTKKKAEKKPEKSENDLEATQRQSVLDIAILQDLLAIQSDSVRRAQTDSTDLRRRMRDGEQRLLQERRDHRDVNSDLSRQYKTMQAELTHKATRLEEEVSRLTGELAQCQKELRAEKRQREQVEREKDAAIAELQYKLDNMESDYEKILHDTLDNLTTQLSVARQGWEDKSTASHQEYKELLADFGLNPLDI